MSTTSQYPDPRIKRIFSRIDELMLEGKRALQARNIHRLNLVLRELQLNLDQLEKVSGEGMPTVEEYMARLSRDPGPVKETR